MRRIRFLHQAQGGFCDRISSWVAVVPAPFYLFTSFPCSVRVIKAARFGPELLADKFCTILDGSGGGDGVIFGKPQPGYCLSWNSAAIKGEGSKCSNIACRLSAAHYRACVFSAQVLPACVIVVCV